MGFNTGDLVKARRGRVNSGAGKYGVCVYAGNGRGFIAMENGKGVSGDFTALRKQFNWVGTLDKNIPVLSVHRDDTLEAIFDRARADIYRDKKFLQAVAMAKSLDTERQRDRARRTRERVAAAGGRMLTVRLNRAATEALERLTKDGRGVQSVVNDALIAKK